MTHTRIMSAIRVGVVLLGLAGMTNAMAFVLPGIPASGFPHFENSVDVAVEPFTNSPRFGDGSLLTAEERRGSFLFRLDDSGQEYNVRNADFETRAVFTDDGAFRSGFVTITGRIPDLFGTGDPAFGDPRGLLYFADLVDFNQSINLIGFETTNASGWASQFQSASASESLYFSNYLSANGGTAITTVPLPGAAYLLGSALAGLFFGAPKRKAGAL